MNVYIYIYMQHFFPTSLCGVLVLLAAIPPASVLPSLRPPRPLLHSSFAHSLTHSLIHHSLTHSLTHSHTQHKISPLTHSLTHSLTLTHSLSLTHSLTHSITDSGSLCSVQRLQKGLRRAWSPLGPSLSAVAGAVLRGSRRGCGARGRRWAPCGSVRYCHCDLQSNGCESHCNGCGQDVRTLCLCTTAIVISIVSLTPALSAVSRDCRRACGARGRRWAPRSLQWQAQYPGPPEGAAARVVAAGPPCGSVRYCHCDLQSNGCDRLRIAL